MWQETEKGLFKQFKFKNFSEAWKFMSGVAEIAEERQHHPFWENDYAKVKIWLISHDASNKITEKDRAMAATIDELLASKTNKVNAKKVNINADGGSRGNPGPAAAGFVLTDERGKVLVDKGVYLGKTTNNQAEYQALKLALTEAKNLGAEEVNVFMDSLLVVNQMKGIYKVKKPELMPLNEEVKRLAAGFKSVNFTQVPRAQNHLADAAVNRALDEQLKLT